MDDDDKVGYCQPPKSGQFKKGESGNPGGRPKGSKNFRTEFNQALNQRIPATVGGRRKTLTKRRVITHQLVNKAASGDLRAIAQVMAHAAMLEPQIAEQAPMELTPHDQAILDRHHADLFETFKRQATSTRKPKNGAKQP